MNGPGVIPIDNSHHGFGHVSAAPIDDDFDGAPCCPDPGCPGRGGRPCTFPGYVEGN